jgi:hypothetical protein
VEKKELVERDNKMIAVARKCKLLKLSRSSYYHRLGMMSITLNWCGF